MQGVTSMIVTDIKLRQQNESQRNVIKKTRMFCMTQLSIPNLYKIIIVYYNVSVNIR